MQSKTDFFDDAVKKIYDHDYLHTLVAFDSVPIYVKMLRDPSLAWCEKSVWDTFTDSEKTRCVAEETYVIAIERFMVPSNWKTPAKLAYMKALNKVCTTLCSGWFRDWAIDHYPDVLELFSHQKFSGVKQELS